MREKLKKIKLMKTNEPVFSVNNLITHLTDLIALHVLHYGQYSKGIFPNYHLAINKANQLSDELIDECLEIEDNIQRIHYQKIIVAIIYYLTDADFDIARYEQSRGFNDSEINIRMSELCCVLVLRPESEIKLIIEYLFDLKNIQADSALRNQINILAEVLHNDNIDEICNTADLSIPFKAELLNFIALIKFPYKNEIMKRVFFIKMLACVYLEMSEGTFLLHKNTWRTLEMHPFIKHEDYNCYINSRYDLINKFLKNKAN